MANAGSEPQPEQLEFTSWRRNPLKRAGRVLKDVLRGVARRKRRGGRRHAAPFASMSTCMDDAFNHGDIEDAASAVSSGDSTRASMQLVAADLFKRGPAFPLALTFSGTSTQAPTAQRLLALGSRHWGSSSWWDTRSLLRIKIYDFAVYADPAKAAQSAALLSLSGRRASAATSATSAALSSSRIGRLVRASAPPSSLDILSHIVRAPQLLRSPAAPGQGALAVQGGAADATLVMHAARDLPVQQLAQEMQNVLLRRNVKAGGSEDDPALRELLHTLSSLPPCLLSSGGDHVKRGGVIAFHRTCEPREGEPDACTLHVAAGGELLSSVRSNSLSSALFDLYLGDEPVSAKTKAIAAKSVQRMAVDRHALYAPHNVDGKLSCAGSGGDPSRCAIQLH